MVKMNELSETFNKAKDDVNKALELLNKLKFLPKSSPMYELIHNTKTFLEDAQKQLNEIAEFYKI
jgi:hypothetical protein